MFVCAERNSKPANTYTETRYPKTRQTPIPKQASRQTNAARNRTTTPRRARQFYDHSPFQGFRDIAVLACFLSIKTITYWISFICVRPQGARAFQTDASHSRRPQGGPFAFPFDTDWLVTLRVTLTARPGVIRTVLRTGATLDLTVCEAPPKMCRCFVFRCIFLSRCFGFCSYVQTRMVNFGI